MALTITKSPETGGSRFDFGSVGGFDMPAISELDSKMIPVTVFHGAVNVFGELQQKIGEVLSDVTLSEVGRQRKVEPLQKSAVLSVATLESVIDIEESHWNKREAALLAVPNIDQAHSVAAIEAREVRDWFRAQSAAEQAKILQQMDNEPGHETMILALLRSPIPQLDHHAKFAKSIWDRTQRLSNVGEAMAIEAGRATVEWSRRGAAHFAVIAKRAVGWSNEQIARTLLTEENKALHTAFKSFGVGAGEVEQIKRLLAQQAGQRWS